MLIEYSSIFIAFVFTILFVSLIYFISYFLIPKKFDLEKYSIYECGFEPFKQIYYVFEVKFYIIALLFVIFDIEIILLLPFIFVINSISKFGILSFSLFILPLICIYIYEWLLGILNW
jgi:NADH:ubiquinone oxidoreductase subunit 3 (subunit A)